MQTQSHADRFLGSWSLVSVEVAQPSGEILHPYGDHPYGLLVYQEDGFMSAQVSVENPSRFASEDFSQATNEEAATAFRNYVSYWGTFKVDTEAHSVTHQVEGSLFANWIGTEQVRHFRFNENGHLMLEIETPAGRYTLTWQRKQA